MKQIDELVLSGLDWVLTQIDLLKEINSKNTPATDNVWTSDFFVDLDKFNFHHENITHYQKIQLPNME